MTATYHIARLFFNITYFNLYIILISLIKICTLYIYIQEMHDI
jgi:hypothetical protein